MSKKGIGLESEKSTPLGGQTHLLVIAIDAYRHCPPLYNCVKDAQDLIEVLTQKYAIQPEHITTLFNQEATKDNIYHAFEKMVTQVRTPDNLLIYFSGHGEYNKNFRQGYWIPVGAEQGRPSQYIPNSEIKIFLGAIPAHHIFLMADSCFSGSLFNQGADRYVSRRYEADPSRWGLTSGRNEIVSDGKPGDNSPFAESLLYRLRQNKDAIGVQELCAHVVEYVQSNANQSPIGEPLRVNGHKNGQFVFRKKNTPGDGLKKEKPPEKTAEPPVPQVSSATHVAAGDTRGKGKVVQQAAPTPATSLWKKHKTTILSVGSGLLLLFVFFVGKQLTGPDTAGKEREEISWERAKKANTEDAYKLFLKEFPNSSRRTIIEKRLREQTSSGAEDPVKTAKNTDQLPIVSLSGFRGNTNLNNIKSNPELIVHCPDTDCGCEVKGFMLLRLSTGQKPESSFNAGATLNDRSRQLMARAKSGDIYFFQNVKVACRGDLLAKTVDAFSVKIGALASLKIKSTPPAVKIGLPGVLPGSVDAGAFTGKLGLSAKRENCTTDCSCGIEYFTLTHVPANGTPKTISNKGSLYQAETLRLIRQAASGDNYYFTDIQLKCGDERIRNLHSLHFSIK